MSVFRSAIQGEDGTVDPGYLALFWTMAVTVGTIPVIVAMGAYSVFKDASQAGPWLQNIGVAIGAMCSGCGVVIGAVGAFRMGDKPRVGTTTSTVTAAQTTTAAPQ